MTEIAESNNEIADSQLPSDVAFEQIAGAALAAYPEAAEVFQRLRELKTLHDTHFAERKSPTGHKLPSEYDGLRTEAGSLVAIAGVASIAYGDLRVGNSAPGKQPTAICGSAVVEELQRGPLVATYEQLMAIAKSAASCDADTLAQNGIPAHVIAASRKPTGKLRGASTRVEWIGKSKTGGAAKGGVQ